MEDQQHIAEGDDNAKAVEPEASAFRMAFPQVCELLFFYIPILIVIMLIRCWHVQ